MSEKSAPNIVIGKNIHSALGINVFEGTFKGERAIHKYIEIYDRATDVEEYLKSLKIYEKLSKDDNICKLLEYDVERPSSPPIEAWEQAKMAWDAAAEISNPSDMQLFDMNRKKIRITMDNCGTDLYHFVHKNSKLSDICFINIILKIAHDVLSAIICLNKENLVHGDIKLENVVIYESKAPETPAAPAPSPPHQDTIPCPTIEAKLIDMDSIGHIDAKRYTNENPITFERYFHIKNVMFNIPVAWTKSTLPEGSKPPSSFRHNLKTQLWRDSKGYIDIFSWCIVCLPLLAKMGTEYFRHIVDKQGRLSSSSPFKNSYPDEKLSKSPAFVKAYILESLISDMCLPDIKIGDIPMDKSLNMAINVNYCEKVASFLLWLKTDVNMDNLKFPVKRRQEWWRKNKLDLINHRMILPKIPIGLVGENLGGGYNKSNRGRDIRKNKHCLSKRIKKRKYKRTHKRKYKRTHKRKYKKPNKTIKL